MDIYGNRKGNKLKYIKIKIRNTNIWGELYILMKIEIDRKMQVIVKCIFWNIQRQIKTVFCSNSSPWNYVRLLHEIFPSAVKSRIFVDCLLTLRQFTWKPIELRKMFDLLWRKVAMEIIFLLHPGMENKYQVHLCMNPTSASRYIYLISICK